MAQCWLTKSIELVGKKVWVTGHTGMVGSALLRRLSSESCEILHVPHAELDLREQNSVRDWCREHRPDYIIHAAARVGGIEANRTKPAEFIYDNIMMACNIVHAAHEAGVKRLLYLGSSCIYPKHAKNPISEDALLSGYLEPTNEAYALAKIAGIKLCQAYRRQYRSDFISVMPCNLYGPGDTYNERNSHVIPALIMKMDKAKRAGKESVTLWGTGQPRREFLYVDDLADALILALQKYNDEKPLNIGMGKDITISELAMQIAEIVGFEGNLIFDTTMPDGVEKKLMDSRRIHEQGWMPNTSLCNGLQVSYADYCERFMKEEARYLKTA